MQQSAKAQTTKHTDSAWVKNYFGSLGEERNAQTCEVAELLCSYFSTADRNIKQTAIRIFESANFQEFCAAVKDRLRDFWLQKDGAAKTVIKKLYGFKDEEYAKGTAGSIFRQWSEFKVLVRSKFKQEISLAETRQQLLDYSLLNLLEQVKNLHVGLTLYLFSNTEEMSFRVKFRAYNKIGLNIALAISYTKGELRSLTL